MYTPLLRDLGVAASQFCAGSLPDSEFSPEHQKEEGHHHHQLSSSSLLPSSYFYSESARVRIIENPIYEPTSSSKNTDPKNGPPPKKSSLTRFHCVNMCQYLRFRNFNEFEKVAGSSRHHDSEEDGFINSTTTTATPAVAVKVSSSSRLYEHAAQRILGWIESPPPSDTHNSNIINKVRLTQREVCVAVLASSITYEVVQALAQQYGLLSLMKEDDDEYHAQSSYSYTGGSSSGGGGRGGVRWGRFHNVAMDTLHLRKEAVCTGGHSVAMSIDLSQYFDATDDYPYHHRDAIKRVGIAPSAAQCVKEHGARSDDDIDDATGSDSSDSRKGSWDLSSAMQSSSLSLGGGMPSSLDPCLMAIRRREHIRAMGAILPMVQRRVMAEMRRQLLLQQQLTPEPPTATQSSSFSVQSIDELLFSDTTSGSTNVHTLRDRLVSLLLVGNLSSEASQLLPMGISEAVDAVAAQLTRLHHSPILPNNTVGSVGGDTFLKNLHSVLSSGSFESSIDLKTSLFGERLQATSSDDTTPTTTTTTSHSSRMMMDTVFHMAHRQSAPEDVHSVSYKRRYARALAERAAILAQKQPQQRHQQQNNQKHPRQQPPTPSTPMKAPEQHYFPPSFRPSSMDDTATSHGGSGGAKIRNVVLLRSWEVNDYELNGGGGGDEDSSERMLLDILTTPNNSPPINSPSSSSSPVWDLIVVQGPMGHAHHALLDGFRLHRHHTIWGNEEVGCDGGSGGGGVIVLANVGSKGIERMSRLLQRHHHHTSSSSSTHWINGSGRVMHLSVPNCVVGGNDASPSTPARLDISMPVIFRPHGNGSDDTMASSSSSSTSPIPHLVLTIVALNAGYDVVTANQLTSEQVSNEDKKARLNPSMMAAISSVATGGGGEVPAQQHPPQLSLTTTTTTNNSPLLPLVSVWITTTSEIRLSCVKQSFWDTITFLTRVLLLMCAKRRAADEDGIVCGSLDGDDSNPPSHRSSSPTPNTTTTNTHTNDSYLSGISIAISSTIIDRLSPVIRRLLQHPPRQSSSSTPSPSTTTTTTTTSHHDATTTTSSLRPHASVVVAHAARVEGLLAALDMGMVMASRLCKEVPVHQ